MRIIQPSKLVSKNLGRQPHDEDDQNANCQCALNAHVHTPDAGDVGVQIPDAALSGVHVPLAGAIGVQINAAEPAVKPSVGIFVAAEKAPKPRVMMSAITSLS